MAELSNGVNVHEKFKKEGATMYRTKKSNVLISLSTALGLFFVLIFAGVSDVAQWKVIDLSHKWENGMPIWQAKFDGISLSAGKTRAENYKIFDGWWLCNCDPLWQWDLEL